MEKELILRKIAEGAKFNGVVYSKNNGQWVTIFVYLDGVYTKLDHVHKTNAPAVKQAFEAQIKAALSCLEINQTKDSQQPNEWLVNGKKVVNNLSYAQMWEKYGTDFE